jgi:ribonuclease VapC
MNEINIGEVYYSLARSQSIQRAETFLHTLPRLPIHAVSNTYEHTLAAARLKARFPISYADAFAVATAQRERAILVTGDPELRVVEDLVPILWI